MAPETAPPKEKFETATALWDASVTTFGDRPAFRHKSDGRWIEASYKQVDDEARALAAGLLALGVEPGDRVCIVAQTRPEWVTADLAIVKAGGVSVPIYPTLVAEQGQYIARDSGARVAIVEDAAQVEKLLPLAQGASPLRLVYMQADAKLEKADAQGRSEIKLSDVLGAAGEAREYVHALSDVLGKGRAAVAESKTQQALAARAAGITPDTTFTIIYTSGTTGTPKGVVISNRCLTAAVQSACRALTLLETDEQYLFLPLAHVLGRELVWAPFLRGAATWFTEGMTRIKDNLLEVRPTFMAGVPRVFEKFYAAVSAGMQNSPPLKRKLITWAMKVGKANSQALRAGQSGGGFSVGLADKLVFSKLRGKLGLDRCRFLISGGAPLAAEIAEFFHATGVLILEGYGLTETMSAVFVNRLDRYRFGTVGPALDIAQVKIADDGEILLKGPSIFREYYNLPDETRAVIDEQGWFHTGDIGELEDGFLRITDRKKDLIVLAGGKKVAPQPIENALKAECPSIGQVMVVGDKKPYCVAVFTLAEDTIKANGGDAAVAASDPAVKEKVEAAVKAVNARLSSFESVKKWAILPADFTEQSGELTPSLKLKRKVVLEKFGNVIEGLYG